VIWHAQLGMMRSLVDSSKHKVRIKAWEEKPKTARTVYRPVASADDAREVAGTAWKKPQWRWPEIEVREPTPQDIAKFAFMQPIEDFEQPELAL
jgi:hypothetical protein